MSKEIAKMLESAARDCQVRAGWYVARIDALLRYLETHPRLDSDDVQLCQSMLREILARFRADRRPLTTNVSPDMQMCVSEIAYAGGLLRISASSRPGGRWRDELTVCRDRVSAYLSKHPPREARTRRADD